MVNPVWPFWGQCTQLLLCKPSPGDTSSLALPIALGHALTAFPKCIPAAGNGPLGWDAKSISSSQSYKLSVKSSSNHFLSSWLFLWECAIHKLIQSPISPNLLKQRNLARSRRHRAVWKPLELQLWHMTWNCYVGFFGGGCKALQTPRSFGPDEITGTSYISWKYDKITIKENTPNWNLHPYIVKYTYTWFSSSCK